MQTRKILGSGNPNKIAIVMTSHGIGDDIMAMPAIAQKISEGFDITVFCKPFTRKIWTSLGCKVYPSVNPKDDQEHYYNYNCFVGETFEGNREIFDLKNEFGAIYELPQWSIEWENGMPIQGSRINFFARLIETTPKKDFSWIEVLRPQKRLGDYILYAPDSASKNRRLLQQMKLYKELKKINEVVMFGQSSLYFFDKECKPMPRHNKKDRVKTSLRKSLRFLRKITILLRNRSLDKNKVITQTFDEFLAYIYSAKKVVACDNGIMNTARALGVPCIPIFGWTPKAYSEQYEEYSKASCEAIKCEYDHEGVDITDRINLILEKAQ